MAKSILHYLNEQQTTIDPDNFTLPTTKDFRSTDELTRNLEKSSIETKNNIKECLYYIEKPYSEVPGYYSEDEVIIVRGKPDLLNSHLGYFDADTLYFPVNKIRDNNAVVIHNGGQFFIKDYLQYASANFGNHSSIGVRFVGINAPESNKYTTVHADNIAEDFDYNDLFDDDNVVIDEFKGRVYYDSEHEDWKNGTAKFYKTDINGVECYCQIINTTKSEIIFSEVTQSFETQETSVKAYITKMANSADNKVSHEITQKLIELIGDKEVVMMLDHNMLNAQANDYPTTYANYGDSLAENIDKTIKQFQEKNRGPYYSGFVGYGQDGYGRFLGCLYVKTKVPDLDEKTNEILGEQWINVTKYLLYHFGADGKTSPNTLELSFNEKSPVYSERHNFASTAFNVYSYDRKPHIIMEDLNNMSYDSINKQRNLQKSILGFDFDSQLKDWTVMIGDCVFLVPPTSIRCVTRNGAESVPLIRSRGSAMKELGQSERIIEMTLFFNDEHGINGIEVETPVINDGESTSTIRYDENTLQPTGETVKYYMNGLRALISMFKLCPFMPINNTYINDVLCVEAVALSSLSISTVPGYPKCISANIQLLEFNYHAYMSELPFDGSEDTDTIQSTNIFEKCIDYESLRYYYQKPLYRGEVAARYPFDSREYLNATYGSKTALQPMSFGDSSIEFYVPNSTHLDRLYQAKLEAISNPIKTQYKVTDDAKAWAAEIGKLYPIINNYISSTEYQDLIDFLRYGPKSPLRDRDSYNSGYLLKPPNDKKTLNVEYIDRSTTKNNSGTACTDTQIYQSYVKDFIKKVMLWENIKIYDPSIDDDPRINFSIEKYTLGVGNHYLLKYFLEKSWFKWGYSNKLPEYTNTYSIVAKFNIGQMIMDHILSDANKKIDIVSIAPIGIENESNKYICGISITPQSSTTAHKTNIINLLKNLSIDINDEDNSANNYSNYFDENGGLLLTLNFDQNDEGEFLGLDQCPAYEVIKRCYFYYTSQSNADGTTQFELPSDVAQTDIMSNKQSTDVDTNSTFEFVKFPNDNLMEDVVVTNISASLNNNLSKIYLKAMDGYAPQYLGGQDTIIEVTMTTASDGAVAAINLLPKLCSEYMRNYRLILSCVPLRINTQFTRMIGVNEVLIDSVDVSTVDKQPGLYEITMRLIATDRTVRNKEALKKLDVNNAGAKTNSATNSYTVRDYFDIKNKIGAAEIYPDLELPTIKELDLYGFRFIRYMIYDTSRIYPDPDFYFIYGSAVANKIIRDSVLESLEIDLNSGYSGKVNDTFTFSDYLGGNINTVIHQENKDIPDNSGYTAASKNISIKSNSVISDIENTKNAESEELLNYYLNGFIGHNINNQYVYTGYVELDSGFQLGRKQSLSVGSIYAIANAISSIDSYSAWNISSDINYVIRSENSIINSAEYMDNIYTALLEKIRNAVGYIAKTDDYTQVCNDNKLNLIKSPHDIYSCFSISSGSLVELNKKIRGETNIDLYHDVFDNAFVFWDWSMAQEGDITDKDIKIHAEIDKHLICQPQTLDGSSNCDLQNIIFSIADALTGYQYYNDNKTWYYNGEQSDESWQFNMFKNNDSTPLPQYTSNGNYNKINDIITHAIGFGPFNIRQYSGAYIKKHYSDIILKIAPHIPLDKLKPDHLYFLNPIILERQIYNESPVGQALKTTYSQEIYNYKLALLYSPKIGAQEMLLNLFLIMLSCEQKGVLFSEIELASLALKIDDIYDIVNIVNADTSNKTEYEDANGNVYEFYNFKYINELINIINNPNTGESYRSIVIEQFGDNIELIEKKDENGKIVYDVKLRTNDKDDENTTATENIVGSADDVFNNIVKSLDKDQLSLMRGNYIMAAMLHIAGGFDSELFNLIQNRDYSALNDIIKDAQLAQVSTQNAYLHKFLLALCGRKVIGTISDLGIDGYIGSEVASGIIDNIVNLDEMNNPFTYTRDSFYDMITTDMRGRMCRAFPTFYMLFVDEGREIGLWKLNDNFYNMSSISEISITKSRKIAADTCNIQMTNMFHTFTTDDEDGKEMAYDLETLSSMRSGIQDVFDSIFSPRKLFLRDYQERMEQNPIDRAQLKPGVRIHVRMGYGSDAYALPTVFNGVVAQVSTGELVNIVCQGDGVELTNVFTDTMTSEDINDMDALPGIRQIANWINTGATPKTILTGFLTTKGTWLHKAANNLSNGRFFDDNTFGINHFGDPDYKDIFGLSECSQNIYEAASTATFNHDATFCTGLQSLYSTTSVPHVSTAIMGKSYWDLMHTMAGVSLDYIASVAPFGLRSTIFYGLPHYYYAYDYIKTEEGRVKEKRKPFQQYHIYSSFGDIIENNISTSSEFMKTNAVGLYSSEGFFGAEKTHRVGPVFVDIDIYPEYQKSMTVDTSLIAQGNLATFLIPYWNEIVENTSMYSRWGIDNENIAWRITARALKDSVKEMYQGELITIGDPSVKPYDIVYLSDVYENMQGGCEVEAVTHILNCQTGFTSSIYVDPLIDIDNQYYQMAHSLSKKGIAIALGRHASVVGLSLAISRNAIPLTKIATHMISKHGLVATTQAAKVLDFFNIGDVDSPIVTKLKNSLTSLDFVTNNDAKAVLNSISKRIDNLAKIKIESLADLTKYIDNLNDIDVSNLQTLLSSDVLDKKLDSTAKSAKEALEEALENVSKNKKKIVKEQLENISKEIVEKIEKSGVDIDDALKGRLNTLKNIDISDGKSIRPYIDAIDDLSKVDNIGDDVFKTIGSAAKNTVTKNTDEIIGFAGKAAISQIDNIDDVVRAATTAARASNPIVFIVAAVLEFAIELILAGTANNAIKRWMRNLETLRIYPLTKNGKVYTAGLNGSLGIVVGSPTENEQGWLQKSLSEFFGEDSFWKSTLEFFIGDLSDIETIAAKYRRENGLPETDSNVEWANRKILDLVSSVYENMSQYNGLTASRLTARRISTLYGNSDKNATAEATSVYNALRITSRELEEFSSRVNNLVLLTEIEKNTRISQSDSFINILHNNKLTQKAIQYNNSSVNIQRLNDNDYPLVCLELYDIFAKMTNYVYTDYNQQGKSADDMTTRIYILSALIPDDISWHSTGYSCDFVVSGESVDYVINMLDVLNEQFNNIFEYCKVTDENDKDCSQLINGVQCQIFNITVRPNANIMENYIITE